MEESIKFGPSGNGQAFYDAGYKTSLDAPKWLDSIGLNAYEYSFGRGFTTSIELCRRIGEEAKKHSISVSVHSPYYINLSNTDDMMIEKSYGYLLKSLEYLRAFGGSHCVFHVASQGKLSRQDAFSLCKKRLEQFVLIAKENGFSNLFLCPETMGKSAQIGTYQEIVSLCEIDDMLIPCYDFGHINALLHGALKTKNDYLAIFNYSIERLGFYKVKNCHIHFSKIQFGEKGEIRHLDFDDTQYGPEFSPLAEAIVELGLTPTIICESASKMSEDANIMKTIYQLTVK